VIPCMFQGLQESKKIGDGAYIGSGSVISKNVEADALALERSPQDQRPGWAAKFRAAMGKRKKSG